MDFGNKEGDIIVAPVRCSQSCGLRRHGAGSDDHPFGRTVHAEEMREIQVQADSNGQHVEERKGLRRNLFVHDLRRWNSLVLLPSCYLWKSCKRMGCDYRLFADIAKNPHLRLPAVSSWLCRIGVRGARNPEAAPHASSKGTRGTGHQGPRQADEA